MNIPVWVFLMTSYGPWGRKLMQADSSKTRDELLVELQRYREKADLEEYSRSTVWSQNRGEIRYILELVCV